MFILYVVALKNLIYHKNIVRHKLRHKSSNILYYYMHVIIYCDDAIVRNVTLFVNAL